MSTIKVVFNFSPVEAEITREDLIEFIQDSDEPIENIESVSDAELLSFLNENGVDEFFDNYIDVWADAVSVSLADPE